MGEGKGQEVGARHCQSTTLTNRWQTEILKKTKKQASLDPQPFKLSSDPTGGSNHHHNLRQMVWVGHRSGWDTLALGLGRRWQVAGNGIVTL